MLRRLLITLVFLVVTLESASPPNYGPFAPSQRPKLYPLTELSRWAVSGEITEFSINADSAPLLETVREVSGMTLAVFGRSRKAVLGPVPVSQLMAPLSPPRAYRADLNRDGKSDYIIEIYSGGNGIAAGFSNVVFVVSSNDQYVTTIFKSDSPSADDFVDLLADGRFQYIQPIFVSGFGVKGKDGREHNYWVYNIYSLEGASFKLQNSLKPGFPRWIMYAGRVNHRPTEQFTDEQKLLLWKPHEQCLLWVPGDACAIR